MRGLSGRPLSKITGKLDDATSGHPWSWDGRRWDARPSAALAGELDDARPLAANAGEFVDARPSAAHGIELDDERPTAAYTGEAVKLINQMI